MRVLAKIPSKQRAAELPLDHRRDTLLDPGLVPHAQDLDTQELDQSIVHQSALQTVHRAD